MNIYQKLSDIRKLSSVVKKTKKGFNYTYAPEEEVLANVTAGMNKNGVSLIPRIISAEVTPYSYTKRKLAKDGTQLPDDIINEVLVSGNMEYTWVNDENPEETVVVPWFFTGSQADASMALGSSMTYAQRQFLLKYFQSASTDGDVESYRTKQKEKEETEERETAKAIVDAIHAVVSAFVEKLPEQRGEVLSLIKKHVVIDGKASADYYKITKPDVAIGLKEAITKYIAEHTPEVGVSNQNGEVKDGVSE